MKLLLKNIYKEFSNGVLANKNINFQLREGEIHALLGENGAGKTTLMKILAGEISADSGDIYIDDELIRNKEALIKKVGMIHQHFECIENFTVAENVMLGDMPVKYGIFVDKKKMYCEIDRALIKFNINLNSRDKVSSLSLADRCKLEILKALYRDAEILIFDEPTTSFNEKEKEELFMQFKKLTKNGYSVIFITHKLNEVKEISDRITVIKNGENSKTFPTAEKTVEEISNILFGCIENSKNIAKCNHSGELFKFFDVGVNRGEIFSFIGLEKNCNENIIKKIFSLCSSKNIKLSYIPEDRIRDGLVLSMNVKDNILNTKKLSEFGKYLFSETKIRDYLEDQTREYKIKYRNVRQPISELSGGNMQKIVIARELSYEADLIFAVYPYRGLDRKTSEFLKAKFAQKCSENRAVIILTSDVDEAVDISDRIAVLLDDEINCVFDYPEISDINKIKKCMIRKKDEHEN